MLPAQKSAISYDFSLLVFFGLSTNREVGKLDSSSLVFASLGALPDRCYKRTMNQGKLEY